MISRISKDKSFISVHVNPSLNTVDTFEDPLGIYYPDDLLLWYSSDNYLTSCQLLGRENRHASQHG